MIVTRLIAAYNQPDQFMDTFNIAVTGLMRSISKYAPSMSMAFSNFCDKEIRYEVYYQLGNYNLVSLPHKIWKKYREFEDLKKEFQEKNQREPSLIELADYCNMDIDEVFEVYQQVGIQNALSIDQKIFPNDDSNYPVTLKDRLEDEHAVEQKREKEDHQILLLSLLRMPLKDRKLFVMIYNLCDLVQDLEPEYRELHNFFSKKNHLRLVSV